MDAALLVDSLMQKYGMDAYKKAIELTVAATRRGDLAEARKYSAVAHQILNRRQAAVLRAGSS
jgi:hypothetical protein